MANNHALEASRAITGATQGRDNDRVEERLAAFISRQPDLGV